MHRTLAADPAGSDETPFGVAWAPSEEESWRRVLVAETAAAAAFAVAEWEEGIVVVAVAASSWVAVAGTAVVGFATDLG